MKENKSMEEGSDEEEASESTDEERTEGVTIPEEFQIKVSDLLESCSSKAELSFIRDAVYNKEDELRKAEMKKDKKGSKSPSEFSTADMPKGY